ncbi:hypothetical protein ACMA1I_03390 [Pontibacter sp. 13R65]|uniref:hypothetical protein n=1 Tax=Pontibacter sp. 13R65 TaxID=3127458 RepID=UPI00301E20CD
MKIFSGLLLLACLFTSCKKEEGLSFPTTYFETQYRSSTTVRMYTNQGEVKNEALIKTFIKTFDRYGQYQPKGVSENRSTGDEVVLEKEQEAHFVWGGSPSYYDLLISGNELLFTAKEETTATYGQNDEYAINMMEYISKHKPLIFDKQTLASSSGFNYSYKTKDRLHAYLNGSLLEFPKLLYTIKSGDKRDFRVNSRLLNNEFDPTVLDKLKNEDTLVVQEFVQVFQKK